MFEKYGSLIRYLRGNPIFDPYTATMPDEYFFLVLSLTVTGKPPRSGAGTPLFLDRRDYANLVPLPLSLRAIFLRQPIRHPHARRSLYRRCQRRFLGLPIPSNRCRRLTKFLCRLDSLYARPRGCRSLPPVFFSFFCRLCPRRGLRWPFSPPRSSAESSHRRSFPPRHRSFGARRQQLHRSLSAHSTPCPHRSKNRHAAACLFFGPGANRLAPRRRSFRRESKRGGAIRCRHSDSHRVPRLRCSVSVDRSFAFQKWRTLDSLPRLRHSISLLALLHKANPSQRTATRLLSLRGQNATAQRWSSPNPLGFWAALGLVLSAETLSSAPSLHSLVTGQAPSGEFLSVPFILAYCVIVGIRFAFELPADLRANWIFRYWLDPGQQDARPIARRVLLLFSLLWLAPAALLSVLFFWGWTTALLHAAILVACTILLVETVLIRFRKIPFTCSYPPVPKPLQPHLRRLSLRLPLFHRLPSPDGALVAPQPVANHRVRPLGRRGAPRSSPIPQTNARHGQATTLRGTQCVHLLSGPAQFAIVSLPLIYLRF